MNLNITFTKYKAKPTKVWKVNKELVESTQDLNAEEIIESILRGSAFTPADLSAPVHYLDKNGIIKDLIVTPDMWKKGSPVKYNNLGWMTREQYDALIDAGMDPYLNKNKKEIHVEDAMNKFQIRVYKGEIGKPIHRRLDRCWNSQQIFGLDIDNQVFQLGEDGKPIKINGEQVKIKNTDEYLTPEDAVRICKETFAIEPFFVYHTYNSKPGEWDKFRILFKIDEPIYDYRMFNFIQLSLMELFKTTCDASCKDAARLFYGTYAINNNELTDDKTIYKNINDSINLDDLMFALDYNIRIKDKANYARNIEDFYKKRYIRFDKGRPAIFNTEEEALKYYPTAEITNALNKYIVFFKDEIQAKNNVKKVYNSNGDAKYIPSNNKAVVHKFDKKNWKTLARSCLLFRDFIDGELLHYPELAQILYSNLSNIVGGQKLIKDYMEKNKATYLAYKNGIHYYNLNADIERAQKGLPNGYRCSNGACRYYTNGVCNHQGKVTDKALLPRGRVDVMPIEPTIEDVKQNILDNIDYQTNNGNILSKNDLEKICYKELYNPKPHIYNIIDEVKRISNIIDGIINRETKTGFDITCIKAPTGFGKTVCYIDAAKPGTLIVAPTHKLATQIKDDLIAKGKSVYYFQQKPELPTQDQEIYQKYLDKGLRAEANRFYSSKAIEYANFNCQNAIKIFNGKIKRDPIKEAVIAYYYNLKQSYEPSTVITIATHERLNYLNHKQYKNIIIDEDIKKSLLQTQSINKKDLTTLMKLLNARVSNNDYDIVFDKKDYIFASVDARNTPKLKRIKDSLLNKKNKNTPEYLILRKKHLLGMPNNVNAPIKQLRKIALKGKQSIIESALNKVTQFNSELSLAFQEIAKRSNIRFTKLELLILRDVILTHFNKFSSNIMNIFEYMQHKDLDYIYMPQELKDKKDGKVVVTKKINNYDCIFDRTDIIKRNIKYIILSATISEMQYKTLFKEIDIISTNRMKSKGSSIQYIGNTSRSSIDVLTDINCNNGSARQITWDLVENVKMKLKKNAGTKDVITFKKTVEQFKREGYSVNEEIYFGNSAGYNTLTGKDIIVFGTPHINKASYLLTAKALGYDLCDVSMCHRIVERNGYRFWFYTFATQELQDIQLNEIETELLQAAGRARILRNDCSVEVYSDYPLPDFDIKY